MSSLFAGFFQQTIDDPTQVPDFLKDYKFITKIKDAQFGTLSAYVSKSKKQEVFVQQLNPQIFEMQDLSRIRNRLKLSHSGLLKIYGFYSEKGTPLLKSTALTTQAIVKNNKHVHFMFELFEKDLATIMATLKAQRKRFTEEELWRISEGLIAALAYLQHNGLCHGLLSPHTVFKKDVDWKISSTQSILREFTKHHFGKGQTESFKQDVYNLGRTLLSATTLQTDINNKEDDHKELLQKAMRTGYSLKWCQLIYDLINPHTHQRPTAKDIYIKIQRGETITMPNRVLHSYKQHHSPLKSVKNQIHYHTHNPNTNPKISPVRQHFTAQNVKTSPQLDKIETEYGEELKKESVKPVSAKRLNVHKQPIHQHKPIIQPEDSLKDKTSPNQSFNHSYHSQNTLTNPKASTVILRIRPENQQPIHPQPHPPKVTNPHYQPFKKKIVNPNDPFAFRQYLYADYQSPTKKTQAKFIPAESITVRPVVVAQPDQDSYDFRQHLYSDYKSPVKAPKPIIRAVPQERFLHELVDQKPVVQAQPQDQFNFRQHLYSDYKSPQKSIPPQANQPPTSNPYAYRYHLPKQYITSQNPQEKEQQQAGAINPQDQFNYRQHLYSNYKSPLKTPTPQPQQQQQEPPLSKPSSQNPYSFRQHLYKDYKSSEKQGEEEQEEEELQTPTKLVPEPPKQVLPGLLGAHQTQINEHKQAYQSYKKNIYKQNENPLLSQHKQQYQEEQKKFEEEKIKTQNILKEQRLKLLMQQRMLEDEKMKIEQERLMKIQLEQEEHQRKIEKIKQQEKIRQILQQEEEDVKEKERIFKLQQEENERKIKEDIEAKKAQQEIDRKNMEESMKKMKEEQERQKKLLAQYKKEAEIQRKRQQDTEDKKKQEEKRLQELEEERQAKLKAQQELQEQRNRENEKIAQAEQLFQSEQKIQEKLIQSQEAILHEMGEHEKEQMIKHQQEHPAEGMGTQQLTTPLNVPQQQVDTSQNQSHMLTEFDYKERYEQLTNLKQQQAINDQLVKKLAKTKEYIYKHMHQQSQSGAQPLQTEQSSIYQYSPHRPHICPILYHPNHLQIHQDQEILTQIHNLRMSEEKNYNKYFVRVTTPQKERMKKLEKSDDNMLQDISGYDYSTQKELNFEMVPPESHENESQQSQKSGSVIKYKDNIDMQILGVQDWQVQKHKIEESLKNLKSQVEKAKEFDQNLNDLRQKRIQLSSSKEDETN